MIWFDFVAKGQGHVELKTPDLFWEMTFTYTWHDVFKCSPWHNFLSLNQRGTMRRSTSSHDPEMKPKYPRYES